MDNAQTSIQSFGGDKMKSACPLSQNLGAIAWGAILVWWGITELLRFPNGMDAVGFGLIFLGANLARVPSSVTANGFSITLGILALVWGELDLAPSVLHLPFKLPVFAILLIVLGMILLAGVLVRVRKPNLGSA
jgi:hypothetical protein